jgi:hypothetical protein
MLLFKVGPNLPSKSQLLFTKDMITYILVRKYASRLKIIVFINMHKY